MMWVSVILTYPATAAVQAGTFGEYMVQAIKPLVCIEDAHVAWAKKLLGFALLCERRLTGPEFNSATL
jgi:hypothetical protein